MKEKANSLERPSYGKKIDAILAQLSGDALETVPVNYDWEGENFDYDHEGSGWYCFDLVDGKVVEPGEDDERRTDGPMMSYYYPLHMRNDEEAREIAGKLSGPLCVVCVDGNYGLALTGGGMDLSWEICEAFIQAGYLPPVHFATSLPVDCRPVDARTKLILSACRESIRFMARRMLNGLESLDRVETSLRRHAREAAARRREYDLKKRDPADS